MTLLPSNLIQLFLLLLSSFQQKPKARIKFLESQWSGNEEHLLILFIVGSSLPERNTEFNRYLQKNFLTCKQSTNYSSMMYVLQLTQMTLRRLKDIVNGSQHSLTGLDIVTALQKMFLQSLRDVVLTSLNIVTKYGYWRTVEKREAKITFLTFSCSKKKFLLFNYYIQYQMGCPLDVIKNFLDISLAILHKAYCKSPSSLSIQISCLIFKNS